MNKFVDTKDSPWTAQCPICKKVVIKVFYYIETPVEWKPCNPETRIVSEVQLCSLHPIECAEKICFFVKIGWAPEEKIKEHLRSALQLAGHSDYILKGNYDILEDVLTL